MYFKKASKELGDPRGFVNIGHIFAEVLLFDFKINNKLIKNRGNMERKILKKL